MNALGKGFVGSLSLPAVERLMERIPGGFFVYRADGNQDFISVNQALVEMSGYDTKEEFLAATGNSFRGFVHPDDLDMVQTSIDRQIDGKKEGTDFVQYRIMHKDGSIRWIRDYGLLADGEEYGNVFYVLVYDVTDYHNYDQAQKNRLLIEQNRYRDVLVNESIFYYEFDVTDGYIRDGFVVTDEFLKSYVGRSKLPVLYDDLYGRRLDSGLLQLMNPEDSCYWTCQGLIDAYHDGRVIVDLEYYETNLKLYCKADILLSRGIDKDSIHAVYVCRDITDQMLSRKKNEAYRQMVMKYLELYADVASAVDMERETFEVISSSGDYAGPKNGWFADIHRMGKKNILPECLEDYTANMNLENISAHLKDSDYYSFQTFVRGANGEVRRRDNSFYCIDKEKRYVLAVRQDTTDSYEREQYIAKIREESSVNRLSGSSFLRSMNKKDGSRRRILVVEDRQLNRQILEELLSAEFEVVCADNGADAISVLERESYDIDLILLDVYMPVMDGFEFLRHRAEDSNLSDIPVIVLTGSSRKEDEEKCLTLGATDYVTKPYNNESLFDRIWGVISLKEYADTMSAVEFDSLTGLYTMPAFMYHASELIGEDETCYDMYMLEIRGYENIRSIHGEKMSSELLVSISHELGIYVSTALIGRQEHVFYIMLTSEKRHDADRINEVLNAFSMRSPIPNIRLKVGIYHDFDQSQPIPIICDRLRIALDSIENDYMKTVVYYDDKMQEKRIEDQKLLAAFEKALEDGEFVPWLQPKVRNTDGRIVSAEALVRWFRDGKMVSPGSFIPLFEREGCIKELDEYIFKYICRYQVERAGEGKSVVPISVNLSRNSLYSEGIVERYHDIVTELNVDSALVPIEITESASTSDNQILDICKAFVEAGFSLHMDDFGTGYSSLSSLSTLPFDVIKLDKSFIDKIGTPKGDILVKNVIDTALDLGMKIVAEGVEHREQSEFLSKVGCNVIQGYYYSAPLSVEKFEKLIDEGSQFESKSVSSELNIESVLNFTHSEVKKYIQYCQSMFSIVRLLSPDHSSYYTFADDGSRICQPYSCHEFWGKYGQCDNCICQTAALSKSTSSKMMNRDGVQYYVTAKYIEIEGQPFVVEMLNEVR